MVKVVKRTSFLERIALFLAGIGCGYVTLRLLPHVGGDGWSQVMLALFAMGTVGGFYGALVGKQSM